jgi:sensor histidine kinase YesM
MSDPVNHNGSNSARRYFCTAIYFVTISLLCLFYDCVYAQRTKIDSLKKSLPFLNDTSKVDCLNVLSLVYSYLNTDTSKAYAEKAFANASAINYLKGKVAALNNEARIAGHGFHNYSIQQKISLQTISLCAGINDETILMEANMNLALSLFCQCLFNQSEKVLQTIIGLSNKNGDRKLAGESWAVLACIKFETGDYEQSFNFFNQSLGLFKSTNDAYNTSIVLAKLGDLYRLSGDQKTALNFYTQSLSYPKGPSLIWHPLADLGDTYYAIQSIDSVSTDQDDYAQTIKSLTVKSNFLLYSNISLAERYITNKKYSKAIVLLRDELKNSIAHQENNQTMRLLLDLGRAYESMKNFPLALYYTKALLRNADQHKQKQYLRDGYKLLYMVYQQQYRTDSAYKYYRSYIDMKDSVAVDEFGKKLALYKAAKENERKQSQITLLSNEKTINLQQLRINEQRLQSIAFKKNILFVSIILLLLLGFFIVRSMLLKQKNEAHRHAIATKESELQKLESNKAKTELQKKAAELEMQALRAQMNPHFIFNSLNSINRYIVLNNKTEASACLVKFSKLVRLILQNSASSLIPLEQELEALKLYLELEAVRYNYRFSFDICIQPDLDVAALKVPPLIIQPYAENAIWHGLMHKEQNGSLHIAVFEEQGWLCYKILDDGVGRNKASELQTTSPSKRKSMGMQITASRINMLAQKETSETLITTTDLAGPDGNAAGTEVLVKIPLCYD